MEITESVEFKITLSYSNEIKVTVKTIRNHCHLDENYEVQGEQLFSHRLSPPDLKGQCIKLHTYLGEATEEQILGASIIHLLENGFLANE